ncbi:MAG: NAD(P)/FAD-dependent oxidoreductase [Thermoplasmata archaeon]
MDRNADVIIVGGGVHGTSLAYHLLRAEAGRVVVLEKSGIGAGATGWSASFIRHHYSNEICVRLVQESVKLLGDLEADTGRGSHMTPNPLLILAGEDHAGPLRENVAMQRDLGVRVEVLAPEEVGRRFPYLDLTGIAEAALEEDAGYGDAMRLSETYAREFRRGGGEIRTGTEVASIRVRGGHVEGVHTSEGPLDAATVVLAAGAWSARLAATADAPIPVTPAFLSVALLDPDDPVRETPMAFDMTTATYWRPYEEGRLLVGTDEETGGNWDPDGLPGAVGFDFLASASRRLARRWPRMAAARFVNGWAGIDAATPDLHPLIGPDPRVEGLYLDTGFSGHGYKFSPAVGRGLAEHITGGKYRSLDLTPFCLERFEAGAVFTSRYSVTVVQ